MTASSITLRWTATPGAIGYVLERKVADEPFAPIAAPAAEATTYTDTGLTLGKTYIYRLKVKTAGGESAFTAEIGGLVSAGGTDTDGDGVSDQDEQAGYDVILKAAGEQIGTPHVASDPLRADSDGDGLGDKQERALFTDPQRADTDSDGLGDRDEVMTWVSSPVDRDTDGDARGNSALFDGQEVSTYRTSPTLADSDGDKYSDYEEIIERGGRYNPLVANTPRLELSVATAPVIDLNITRTADQTRVTGTSTSLTLGQEDRRSASDTQTQRVTAEVSATIEASVEAGFPSGASASASASATVSAGYGYEKTATYSEESVRSSQTTAEKNESLSTSDGYSLNGGNLKVGFRVRNTGDISFALKDLQITALRRDPSDRKRFVPVGTMTVPSAGEGTTLSSGGETGILSASLDLPGDLALQLQHNPRDLLFQFSTYNLLDDAGRNFEFLKEVTNAKTALVVIDYGNGDVVRQRVATNVQRRDGQIVGVRLGTVLKDILGLPYQTQTNRAGVRVLTSVYDNGPVFKGDVAVAPSDHALWATIGSADLNLGPATNADDILLTQNSTLHLMRVRDQDSDGLFDNEEYVHGTSDTVADGDGDGLNDGEEVKVGWNVIPLTNRVKGYPRRVFPSPLVADADGDGLNDSKEQALGTSPFLKDTDGDGLPDNADTDPLYANVPPVVDTVRVLPRYLLQGIYGTASDSDSNLQAVQVDWGDGSLPDKRTFDTPQRQTDYSLTHEYAAPGTYTVRVQAIDVRGLVSETKTTTVMPTPTPTPGP
ncbi:hypothetical protein CVO96_20285 [Deinococcus koreensis]|uniref:PKD domain-containing protein n=1 Tax=Deinococcus koreensis TaxID=2054903 RepID=A0A2K3URT3_9DEIO|nr:hypothetical protein CVO96_20285 [Deinococcus koreensis]